MPRGAGAVERDGFENRCPRFGPEPPGRPNSHYSKGFSFRRNALASVRDHHFFPYGSVRFPAVTWKNREHDRERLEEDSVESKRIRDPSVSKRD